MIRSHRRQPITVKKAAALEFADTIARDFGTTWIVRGVLKTKLSVIIDYETYFSTGASRGRVVYRLTDDVDTVPHPAKWDINDGDEL